MSRSLTENLSQPTYNPIGFDPYPDNEEGWKEVYDFRWQCVLQYPYSAETQKAEHLFRAFDDQGNEIDQTRRLFRFFAFICETDARTLSPGLVLEASDKKLLGAGEQVWRRSRMGEQLGVWFHELTVLGDGWVEAVRMSPKPPHRTRLVHYDPRHVTPFYDVETGTELERVEIEIDYMDRPLEGGIPGEETTHSYKRVLTRTRIDVYRNGELMQAESGEHGLGEVPAVQLRCIPWDRSGHSLCAASGVERALMFMDSLVTQGKAIGTRWANPTTIFYGFKVGDPSSAAAFGRMINGAPKDGRAEHLEAKAASIDQLLKLQQEVASHIREVSPEFLFSDSGARESAEARSLRGQAFEAKMLDMRDRNYAALRRVIAMAVAMEERQRWDPDRYDRFRIDAPPILPRNVKAELEALDLIKGDLKRADRIRHLQRLGLVDATVDPEKYAAEVQDEQAVVASQFFTEPPAAASAPAGAPNV